MQKELVIDLVNLKRFTYTSSRGLNDYIILQMIYEGIDIKEYVSDFNSPTLLSLQQDLYIKILDNNIEPRAKLNELFEKNSSKLEQQIDLVLLYLKEKVGYSDRFNIKTNAHRKFVLARLKEKNTVEDLKKVVDLKCEQWNNTSMEQYLRPATLFNAEKFSSYIIEVEKKSKQTASLNKMV